MGTRLYSVPIPGYNTIFVPRSNLPGQTFCKPFSANFCCPVQIAKSNRTLSSVQSGDNSFLSANDHFRHAVHLRPLLPATFSLISQLAGVVWWLTPLSPAYSRIIMWRFLPHHSTHPLILIILNICAQQSIHRNSSKTRAMEDEWRFKSFTAAMKRDIFFTTYAQLWKGSR
jgi:hypothetical protein